MQAHETKPFPTPVIPARLGKFRLHRQSLGIRTGMFVRQLLLFCSLLFRVWLIQDGLQVSQ